MDVTGEQIKNYIINELDSKPRHNVEALAVAINHIADEVEYDPFALMQLLLENKPIDALHTHSYGFHTANGRSLIEGMQNTYYEEVQFYVD
jgi:hypothetical protein|tara:strand:+ start:204 stop:476 length:273 start_codon:yes stop_codon:yes gene_type:complete